MSPPNGPLDRPERAHPAHEDTDPPPKPVPGVPGRYRASSGEIHRAEGARRQSSPEIDATPQAPLPAPARPSWFVHWSPGSIAAAVVAIIVALGGATGLRELLGSGEATRRAIAESESRIMAKLEEQRVADQRARDGITTRATVEHEQLELTANLACALNDGPAHPSWPCDLKLVPPPPGNASPRWTTARAWPDVPR